MAWRIEWTEVALDDLEQVWRYIARDSEYYASAFIRQVREAARSLAYLPNRHRVVPEFGDEAIRETYIKQYRLIYQVTDEVVYILAFIHGARDLLGVWRDENRPWP